MMRQRSLLVVDLLNQEVERFSFDLCSAKLSICCSSSFRGANRGLPKLDLFLLFRNPDHPSSGYLAQSTREKTGASTLESARREPCCPTEMDSNKFTSTRIMNGSR